LRKEPNPRIPLGSLKYGKQEWVFAHIINDWETEVVRARLKQFGNIPMGYKKLKEEDWLGKIEWAPSFRDLYKSRYGNARLQFKNQEDLDDKLRAIRALKDTEEATRDLAI
jgi:hypothetical protein